MADTRGIRAGRAFVELGVSDKLTAGLRKAQQRLQAFGAGLRTIGVGMVAAASGVLTPLAGAVRQFAGVGDALHKMSARTSVSAEALSELGFAAEQSGTDLETLELGLRRMQKVIGDAAGGSDAANSALGQLGLTLANLQGLSPEQQFSLIADRISRIQDPALRASAAMELFGQSGTQLLPMMQDGAKGIEQLRAQARSLGLTVSTEAAKDAATLNDTLNMLWRTVKQGVFAIGSALAPSVTQLAASLTKVVVSIVNWIKQNKAVVVTVAKVAVAVAAAGVALIGLGFAVSAIASVIGALLTIASGVAAVFGAIGTVLGALLSPIGLVVGAIGGLGVALLKTSGLGSKAIAWLKDGFAALSETVSNTIGGIIDALKAGDLSQAANILWLGLKLAWQQGVAALQKVWLDAKKGFMTVAHEMWYGALAAAEDGFHSLEVAWIETTAFLSTTWTNFTASLKKCWNTASNWVTKRWLELQGLFDESFDVETAKQMADQELAATNAEIERQRQATVAAREQRRQNERAKSEQVHQATLVEIGKQFNEAQQALDKESGAKIAETQKALDEAKRKLDEALAAARNKGGPNAPASPGPGGWWSGLTDSLADVGDMIAAKISITGTFNPVAVQGLAAGNDAALRTAAASEQTAKNTKRLVDAMTNGGATFV